ncbi:MAG: heme-binding domain-containing protein [Vicingus serpentipes]|nr:heme-binding domain-containing protein [Vicingus serpentipes]
MKKKILYALVGIAIIIQFFRIDQTNPEFTIKNDFIEINQPPKEVTAILKSACYDCHSNESKYPWYANVSPISWWLKHHIDEGREELNFSEWGTFKAKRKDHKLEEIIELVEEGEMPLKEYTWTHAEAKLTEEQKSLLINWVKEIRAATKKKKNEKTLHLNNGKKWVANIETTAGINRMITAITPDVEEGRISLYSAMGEQLNIEIKTIFETCTMEGEAHKQLHLFLVPLVKMSRDLEDIENEDEAAILQKDILKYLHQYNTYFE